MTRNFKANTPSPTATNNTILFGAEGVAASDQSTYTISAIANKVASSISGVGAGELYCYDTVSDLQSATVPNYIAIILINRYFAGDRNLPFYVRRVSSVPSHPWYFTSADGAYWEGFSTTGEYEFAWFGAKSDGNLGKAECAGLGARR